MKLSLEELRAVIKTAEAGTISRAARSLGVTQPTLSWTIRKLEARFDTPLFIRGRRGVQLTRPGDVLVSRARELLRQWEQLEVAVRDERERVQGRYSIGVYPALAEHTLPRFLPKLLSSWPDLEIDIGHDFSQQIAHDVIEFRYDFGIVVNPPRHPELTIVQLYKDEIGFWRATDSAWRFEQSRVPVIYHPTMMGAEGLIQKLQRSGLLEDCRFVHSSDLRLVSKLTAAGGGVGILPDTIAETEHSGNLIPCEGSPSTTDHICLIWRSDNPTTRARQAIKTAIRTALERSSNT